jgi:Xaa-Pro aminopeptidase
MHEFLRRGSRGFAYTPIIGSGKNACVLHYITNDHICREGDVLLMDVAAEYLGWNSDMTRSVPVSGRFTPRQKDIYNAVLRVMRGANALLRPGIHPGDYQREVVAMVEKELIDLKLITLADAKAQGPDKALVKKYFMHGTSHHLGLDVHDVSPPFEPFAEGMVLTIEPGIYIREEGIGIRLENNVVIGASGNIDLMKNIPIEAEEIEDLMNAKA